MDTMTPAQRSALMSRIRSKNTKPEWVVRRLVHSMGFRYRLHKRDLPGNPDLVFPSRQKVIFVHGCFWHLHGRCRMARMPKSKVDFWKPKLEGNHKRDDRNRRQLRKAGWEVLTLWECQVHDSQALQERIKRFLDPAP
jgi:DNA mismatch endonuclease (patch repair protein)